MTNWEHASIDHWIEQGALASHAITPRGKPCRVVTPAQLFAFNRQYIPISSLVKLVGVKAWTNAQRIPAFGVLTGKAVGRGNPRGALVLSAHVAEMAVKVAALGTLESRNGRTRRTWKLQ